MKFVTLPQFPSGDPVFVEPSAISAIQPQFKAGGIWDYTNVYLSNRVVFMVNASYEQICDAISEASFGSNREP